MEQHNTQPINPEPTPKLEPGAAHQPTPNEPSQIPILPSLPALEVTHTLHAERFTMRITEKGGQFVGVELDALKDGVPLITFSRAGAFGKFGSELLQNVLKVSQAGIPSVYISGLGSMLTHTPPGSWRHHVHCDPGHDASLLLTTPPILPTLDELFGSADVLPDIVVRERRTPAGSTLFLARHCASLATIELLISESLTDQDDPKVRTFTLYTPVTATTTLSEIAAWQSTRLETVCSLLNNSGPQKLLEHLSTESEDAVETASSPSLRRAMEVKLANWEYTPAYASTLWDKKDDMYVTTHIGVKHALIAVRYEESKHFPPVWIQFRAPGRHASFSSAERNLIAGLAQKLTSSEKQLRDQAIHSLTSPLRHLGIVNRDLYKISPECPAALYLDSLIIDNNPPRYTLREIAGSEAEAHFMKIPHLTFGNYELRKQDRLRLDLLGAKPFSLHFDTASPGGHIPDLFRISRFLFCADGSFHVELHNSVGGVSRAYIETNHQSRPTAFLELCHTLSEQGSSGWLPVQQLLSELQNTRDSDDSLALWDPGLATLPPLSDPEGIRMYCLAARIVNDLRDLKGERFLAKIYPIAPGECALTLDTGEIYPKLQLYLSHGLVTSCAAYNRNLFRTDSSTWKEVWRTTGPGIPITSTAGKALIAHIARYITSRSPSYFPDSTVMHHKPAPLHPALVSLQEFFEGQH